MAGEIRKRLHVSKEGIRDLKSALVFVNKTIQDEHLVACDVHIQGLESSTGNVEWFDVEIEGRVRDAGTDSPEHREGG